MAERKKHISHLERMDEHYDEENNSIFTLPDIFTGIKP